MKTPTPPADVVEVYREAAREAHHSLTVTGPDIAAAADRRIDPHEFVGDRFDQLMVVVESNADSHAQVVEKLDILALMFHRRAREYDAAMRALFAYRKTSTPPYDPGETPLIEVSEVEDHDDAARELSELKTFLATAYPRPGAEGGPFPCPNRRCYGPNGGADQRGHIYGQSYDTDGSIDSHWHEVCPTCGGEGTLLAAFERRTSEVMPRA